MSEEEDIKSIWESWRELDGIEDIQDELLCKNKV